MNHRILSIALILLLGFSIGCDDYLDINQDPNVLSEIPDEKVLLPAAEIGLGNQLMGWDFGFGGGFWSQYWTQNYTASQFKTLCEYQETSFLNAYPELTAGVLGDLEKIKVLSSNSDDKGNFFVAEALSIYTWQILTDVWGSIPYFEALKGAEGIVSPKFDDGEVVYTDLLQRIDNLLAIDLSSASIDGDFDFVYAGELAKWKLFVNSLKLKLMIRLSETSGYNNSALLSFVENNSFLQESAKIGGSVWSDDQEGKRHPMREFEEGGAKYLSTNVIACKTFLDYLITKSDPRLNTLFTAPSGGHLGAFFGDFDSKEDSNENGKTDDKEVYSTALFLPKMDLVIMSTWEVNFYIAEVYARASDNINAKKYYDLGVVASLNQHGISDYSIIGVGGSYSWIDGTIEDGIKQIAMQKWVANANYQHIESFLERNRTKYPSVDDVDVKKDRTGVNDNFPVGSFTISVNGRAKTNANLPASPTYPASVLTRNTNAPSQKLDLLEKVWWNKKVGK